MANDKDFIVKNAVEVGGSTKTTLGTVTNDDIDLSTGNYFAHSPSGATTYTISNAATNQSFQLEVTGGTEEVAQNFNVTALDNVSFGDTITTNVDLATDGGLIWLKKRDDTYNWHLVDTVRGAGKYISSNSTAAQATDNDRIKAFNTDGFLLGSDVQSANNSMVYFSFKKAAGFFDIVTYTGNGTAGRTISHNLGSVPGCIIVKKTSSADAWAVWHRGANGGNAVLVLNATSAQNTNGRFWWGDNTNYIAPTSTEFTVSTDGQVNSAGSTYVAYLFAHDTASDGLIQSGSFTTNSSRDASVTLGWQPQWILYKRTDGSSNWGMHDTQRVWSETYWNPLYADTNNAESGFAATRGWPTSTGFEFQGQLSASANYIYMAIRSAADLDLTWPTSIEWAGGVTPAAPATGETDLFSISTDDGGTTYQGFKVADNLS